MLKPIGAAGVKAALVPLMLTQQLENLDNLPEGFEPAVYLHQKSAEYERHLAHIPVDILRASCDAHAKASKFFPAVAELIAYATPMLDERKQQQSRIALLIRNGGKPTETRAKTWAELTPDERRAATIEKLKGGIPVMRKHKRLATAIQWERELADLEGRPMERWALEPIPEAPNAATIIAAASKPITGTLPRDDRHWDKASDAAKWQAGAPVYQPKPPTHEEPPMPNEIPE